MLWRGRSAGGFTRVTFTQLNGDERCALGASLSFFLLFSLRGPDRSHWRRIEVQELCGCTYWWHVRHTWPCAQAEKIGRVSALPGINLSGVVRPAGPEGRFVRAAIRHSIKPNSIHRAIDLSPQRPRKIPIILAQKSATGNRKSNGAPFALPFPSPIRDQWRSTVWGLYQSLISRTKNFLLRRRRKSMLSDRRRWLNFGKRPLAPTWIFAKCLVLPSVIVVSVFKPHLRAVIS